MGQLPIWPQYCGGASKAPLDLDTRDRSCRKDVISFIIYDLLVPVYNKKVLKGTVSQDFLAPVLFFASGVGFPLYPEIFYIISLLHNDPAAH